MDKHALIARKAGFERLQGLHKSGNSGGVSADGATE